MKNIDMSHPDLDHQSVCFSNSAVFDKVSSAIRITACLIAIKCPKYCLTQSLLGAIIKFMHFEHLFQGTS